MSFLTCAHAVQSEPQDYFCAKWIGFRFAIGLHSVQLTPEACARFYADAPPVSNERGLVVGDFDREVRVEIFGLFLKM